MQFFQDTVFKFAKQSKISMTVTMLFGNASGMR